MNERIRELKHQALLFAQKECGGTYRNEKGELRADIMTEKFAKLIREDEREACAEIADKELDNTMVLTSYPPKSSAAWNIRAAIRARGET